MKIGVIGTGAVGGYYGALLVKNGFDVHFLLRSDFARVRDHGLLIESVNGDFVLDKVHAYGTPEDMPVCDMVIVALKTTQNDHLASILPKITGKDGIVVLLQNGLGGERDISKIVPSSSIIGGLCFICSQKINPGHIRHLDYGSIRFGLYQKGGPSGRESLQLKTVADIFSKSGVPVHLAENLEKARWEKLVWNMGFNGLTVILNATTDQIMKNTASRTLVRELMIEVIAGARACGYDMEDKFADTVLSATEQMPAYSPSMKLDFEAGRPLEIDSIYWRPIAAAEKHGCDMPKTKVVARQLDFLNRAHK
ncbi:MAG: putative 2-dehydropantoate 2-reductase [Desulfobacteraceae bacterium]|nr:MAG: putative 2-dehydropantoate 2-reductase [Desulfobacteraceae bacterium]